MVEQERSWNPFDPSTFAQTAEDAEKAFAPVSFGKLKMATRYMEFHGKGVQPTDVDAIAYAKLDPKSRGIEMQFSVDSTEFNPNAKVFPRRVALSSKDWRKTTAPSILEVFGEYKNLREGVYVEMLDVPMIDKPELSVPKFVRTFPNVNECAKAWAEKFGNSSGNGHVSSIPAAVVAAAKTVYELVKSDETFKQIAAKDPNYSQFPIDELLSAVKS